MNIRIYQIDMERDTNNVAFINYESLEKFQGSQNIDSSIYDKVFEGEVTCQDLEEVFVMFNVNHPTGYTGRSLSVSDVVEITGEKSTFHFCDSFGFKYVEFDPSVAIDKSKIKVVHRESGKQTQQRLKTL
ncbi:MAG: YodL domain-containing protein [Eubacteriales bacterium]|nr:YodL domain-containing protein [Eubacteriales bacterium]MDD4474385.1 YodL domain-containing protein [Eubacteriales bacterium]